MSQIDTRLSTGLPGIDRILKGLIPGDNLVWQVESIEDYVPFVDPYSRNARDKGGRLIYFRFAKHRPVVPEELEAEVHTLHPDSGFETFISEIHQTIEKVGRGGFYVFDCLSDLAADWYSDEMLGCFFMLTCPYLYDVQAIAYFALLRGHHSADATTPISETAQIVINTYSFENNLYVHPLKVQQRHSPTMYMLHMWEGDDFLPVSESAVISEIMTSVPWSGRELANYRLGILNRTFLEAREVQDGIGRGEDLTREAEQVRHRLLRMFISRDERILRLAEDHLCLEDLLQIKSRMIGTGLIGGKSVGMLLARAILKRHDPRWAALLEPHDSFYVGSDVFYTFLVRNGCWWVREKQKDPATFLDGAERARQRMLVGTFPQHVRNQFADMLDYFGQSPIIVRSSSLLEDNFGNAFAGKYESVFCANQGSRHQRLDDFLAAVRTIYASTMSEGALRYRAQRDLLDRDEQMALLVQRVSGAAHEKLFYPQAAGVGLSYNPYVWSEHIDSKAGMLRLVFGLGTRAVDRYDDDYTRIVALNAPERRPEGSRDELRQYTQRRVDVLDLESNQLKTSDFAEVARQSPQLPLDMFVSEDAEVQRYAAQRGIKDVFPWVLSFKKLIEETSFISDMRAMLKVLQETYDYPVDTEFTVNFFSNSGHRINLLQCRPLQVKGGGVIHEPPRDIRAENLILEAQGAVIGQNRLEHIDRLIYVVPAVYGQLPLAERHSIARLIGKLTHLDESPKPNAIMLLGPGRWGTGSPSLGVPVTFAEINTVSVLCEIVAMRDGLVPDVSLGTHFFNDIVESDILYLALFPGRDHNSLNSDFFEHKSNKLSELLPQAANWAHVVKVVDSCDLPGESFIRLYANSLRQQVLCYSEHGSE